MKNYFFCFLAIACMSLVSCSDDDEGSCTVSTGPIMITVEGVDMTNINGTAVEFENSFTVNIEGESSNDARVFFTCPNEVGIYDLNLDLSGGTASRTITAFVPSETLNVILSSGCYEVVSIDASEVVIRFNASEDGTSVDGEITLDVL